MNDADASRIIAQIEGHWNKLQDVQSAALHGWLTRTKATPQEVARAVDAMIEENPRFAPKAPALAAKLREMGSLGGPQLGHGDPGVLARMRSEILDNATTAAALHHMSLKDRLREELAAAREYQEQDFSHDLGGADYWRDRVKAIGDLLLSDRLEDE